VKTPGIRTLEQLFAGRPAALELFFVTRAVIESFGPVLMEVMKTQVSFGAKTKFAWVCLPQMWIRKQPEEGIALTFSLKRRIGDSRVKEVVEPRPGRFTHHVFIWTEADLDNEVRAWLREAYEQHL